MPDWRMIKSQKKIEISVDAEEKYQNEIDHLNSLIHNRNIQEIIKRYPVHKTGALEAMARALQFNHRISFEAAARKLIREDDNIKQSLLSYFGPLVRELN